MLENNTNSNNLVEGTLISSTKSRLPIRPMYKNFGRPVLVSVSPEYSNLGNRNLMLAVPYNAFFGAETYFFGEEKITTSCGMIEYDAESIHQFVKGRWPNFKEASDEDIYEALKDSKCTPFFKKLVLEIMDKIDLTEEDYWDETNELQQ